MGFITSTYGRVTVNYNEDGLSFIVIRDGEAPPRTVSDLSPGIIIELFDALACSTGFEISGGYKR